MLDTPARRIPQARAAARASWRAAPLGRVASLGLCAWLVGCAYFNTFYNANQLYKEAERLREGPGGGSGAAATYGRCIDKCHDLIRYHPNSGYIDDALFMIGMSHLHRGENVQAQDSFRDLLERFPETDFRERAWFNMGFAALSMGDVGGASQAFQSLRDEYPSSKYNVEAVFRSAEKQLDSSDNDAAREALAAFIVEYPKSSYAVDAQVMIARTYFSEQRYEEARREFEAALDLDLTDELRYDARLHVALAKRNQAEQILADPALYTSDDLPDGLRLELPQPVDSLAADAGAVPPQEPGSATDDAASTRPSQPHAVADIAAQVETLPDSLRQLREAAFDLLREGAEDLEALRKPARKLGSELSLRVELALTVSFLGDPDAAIAELDQIARTDARGMTGAQAQYAIGEIHRRRGRLEDAQRAYDAAQRGARNSDLGKQAQQMGVAIRARRAALEQLGDASEVLRRMRVVRGQDPPTEADADLSGSDSARARLELDLRFEESAGQLLRVAEIDLLELGQSRLALREFQRLLRDYPGSRASARAAFAIAWIYDTVLLDVPRALDAYDAVVREYPESPQARQARESARDLRTAQSRTEVGQPSSPP
jgi:TolA-binding protein